MTDAPASRPVLNGRYELHRRIARGGMADVFLARDSLLDRPVAVKVLFPQFAAEASFVERFRREAQAAANLNHPSIVAVYDWGEHDNTYFIVMEYVEGRSLAEVLRAEGTLHPDRSAEICTDVAAALSFAHRNGTVHRDVKPGNILITKNGQVKVTDFGIARAFGGGDELTQTGSVMGTASYFSPEQAQGKNVDPRSDLYSLGVVLFEMVAGRPPFQGDSPVAIAYKHVQEAPPRPTSINPAIPKTLEAVIARLLAKSPAQRYASAEDVRADLRRFREGHPLVGVGAAPAGTQPNGQPAQIDPSTVNPVVGAAGTGAPAAGNAGVMDAAAAAGAASVVGAAAGQPTMAQPVTAGVPAGQVPATSTGQRAVIDTTRAMPAATAVQQDYVGEEYYEPPRRNGVFFGMLAVLLIALGGIVLFIATQFGGDDGTITPEVELIAVPAVVGDDQETAVARLSAANLQPQEIFEINADVTPGVVFEQDPRQGEEVEEGSTVLIKISQSEDTVALTDVRGQDQLVATQVLNGLGLRVDYEREANDEFDEGIVIGMSPEPNQEVNSDALITLTVSTGPAQVEVPQLFGLTLQEASNLLGQRGLPNPEIRPEPSAEVEVGQVIRSDPEAGTPVSIDRQIILYISDGPETALVPSVVGLTQAAAEQAIFNKEFIPIVVLVDVASGSPDAGKVISQEPAASSDLQVGQDVTITVGQEVAATTTSSTATTQPTSSETTEEPTSTTEATTTSETTADGG